MIGKLFSKMSSPKFTLPQVSVAISGRSSSTLERSCGVIPIAPPVENCTMRSLCPANRLVRLTEAFHAVRVAAIVVAAMHVQYRGARLAYRSGGLSEQLRRIRQMRRLFGPNLSADGCTGDDQRVHGAHCDSAR